MNGQAPPAMPQEAAREFIASAQFYWHQRFELAPGVFTPGAHNIEWLLSRCGVPERLDGQRVLDIGTNNGGAAFALERRGASVTALDIYPPEDIGFTQLRGFLGSHASYVQGTVYDASILDGYKFDLILCLGVLYHLRHPLLALDNIRRLADGQIYLETEIEPGDEPRSSFYRQRYATDPTTWFVPTRRCAEDWCVSSGFDIERADTWGSGSSNRALFVLRATRGEPEYVTISYEYPLRSDQLRGYARSDHGRSFQGLWSRFSRLGARHR